MRFQRRVVSFATACVATAFVLCSPSTVLSSEYKPVDNSDNKLGIGTTFGRWQDGVVPWVYNPTDAPAIFSDNAYFVSLLQEAMAELEGASGLHFDYQGIDSNATISNLSDGVVTIGWEDIGGAAGQAGPAYSCTAQDVIDNGYCPYTDGTGRFNNNSANVTWDTGVTDFTERKFLQVATHEFMHLVGIGHSDIAESIMYANPYTNLQHLRPDDIEALQAVYGPPGTAAYASVYTPPGAGASPLQDSYISLDTDPFSGGASIIDGSEGASFVGLYWQVPNGYTDDLTIVATDPSGHFYNGRVDDRNCSNPGCGFWLSFATYDAVVLYPGIWTVYCIVNGDLVATETTTVTTSPTFNHAPDSTLVHDIIDGPAPFTTKLTLSVTGDDEGDAVDATWHIPGTGEIHLDSGDFPGSIGTYSQTVTFDEPGTYEIYVEVNDDWTRYGSGGSAAGPGYRSLYRRVVHVDKASADVATFGDVTGDSVPDLAGFIKGPNAKPQIAIYSGADQSVHAVVKYLTENWRGIALGTIADANQDGTADDPAVALLADNDVSGKVNVEWRRLDTGALLNRVKFFNSNWRAIDLAVIDDLDGDGQTDDTAIAVLAQQKVSGLIRVRIRLISDRSLVSNIGFLGAQWSPVALAVVDRSAQAMGPISPLLGVLAENRLSGQRRLQSRFASSGNLDRNIKFFTENWDLSDVTATNDVNGDGVSDDPAWQVLGTRTADNLLRVQTRLVSNGNVDKTITFLNRDWDGLRVTSAPDINGNSSTELAVSARKRADGERRINILDYKTKEVISDIYP